MAINEDIKRIKKAQWAYRHEQLLKKYQKLLVVSKITDDLNAHLLEELHLWKTGEKTPEK